MSKKSGHKAFKPGLNHIIRWVIFGILFYYVIQYLSQNPNVQTSPSLVLGESVSSPLNLKAVSVNLLQKVPAGKLNQLNNIMVPVTNLINQAPVFINDQIIKFKKDIVTRVYQDIIKSIEKK